MPTPKDYTVPVLLPKRGGGMMMAMVEFCGVCRRAIAVPVECEGARIKACYCGDGDLSDDVVRRLERRDH